jgi:hypothetical protein
MMNFLYPLSQLRHGDLQIIFTKANEEKKHNIKLTIVVTFEFAFSESSTFLVYQIPRN